MLGNRFFIGKVIDHVFNIITGLKTNDYLTRRKIFAKTLPIMFLFDFV